MGLSALWSFAELLRIAAAVELDVDPHELRVGLQPWKIDDTTITRRVIIADSLENGAGYARHISSPEVLKSDHRYSSYRHRGTENRINSAFERVRCVMSRLPTEL